MEHLPEKMLRSLATQRKSNLVQFTRVAMTEGYREIQKRIEALQRQADKLRKKEAEGVVTRIGSRSRITA